MNIAEKINQANQLLIDIFVKGQPIWTDVCPAGTVIPDMLPNMILYAGPFIEKEQIVLPVKNAICGAAVHEGLASSMEEPGKRCCLRKSYWTQHRTTIVQTVLAWPPALPCLSV